MKKLALLTTFLITLSITYGQTITSEEKYIVGAQPSLKSGPIKPRFRLYALPDFSKTKTANFDSAKTTTDKTYIDFVGSGDIQKAISGGQQLNANTGAGIIFERYRGLKSWFQSLEMEVSINIATTSDTTIANVINKNNTDVITNQRDFGSYMINPQSGKQAIYANANLYFGYPDHSRFKKFSQVVSGVNFRFIGSNNVWQYTPSNTPDIANVNVGGYELRLGIFHEFLPDNIRIDTETKRAKYSLFLGLNYSLRGLVGDITSEQNLDLKRKFLGTDGKDAYQGIEINTGFRLSNLRLEFNVPILSAGKSAQIPGLTNTQFLFTIRFIGGFGLELNTASSKVTDDKKNTNQIINN